MKRYAFTLNRVLRVRSTQEDLAKQVLRGAAARAARADEEYESAVASYQASVASEAALRGSIMSMMAMRDLDAMRARAIIETEGHAAQARAEAEAARDLWAQAKQKVSALERLDETQRAEHQRGLLAEAEAEADDVVTSRPRRARAAFPGAARPGRPA